MVARKWAVLVVFLSSFCVQTRASHFNGATFQWRPVDAENFDGLIEVSHRVAWTGRCVIGNIILQGSILLQCQSGCTGAVGNLDYICTDYSPVDDLRAGEMTYTYNIGTNITNFEASFSGCCWRNLVSSGGSWEIRVKGNLSPRADNGRINSSPVTTTTPVVNLQAGCIGTIRIPVQDIDGDTVRCRWAFGNDSDECADTCNAVPGAILDPDTCTLTWDVNGTIGLYAVAVQIEDFISPTSTVALSSVPLQFLINVFSSTEPCTGGTRPSLVAGETPPHNSIVTLSSDATYSAGLVADSGGPAESIVRFITASPVGMNVSSVEQSPYNPQHYYVNVTWTPEVNQTRPRQIFCFRASSSNGLESEQSCITFIVDAENVIATAGDSLTLTCAVAEDTVGNPILQWLGPVGSAITNTESLMGDLRVSTVRFLPLRTSHNGSYTCRAIVGFNLRRIQSVSVIVRIPPPVLTLSLDGQTGTEGSAITGTVVSLQGLATLADVVDTPVNVLLAWSRPDPNGLLDLAQLTSPPYTLTTTFDPLSVGGVYEFIVAVDTSNPSFVRSVTVNASYTISLQPYPPLEIRIRGVLRSGDCVVAGPTATLTGSVSLLPNIATDHTLSYTWSGPGVAELTPGQTLVVSTVTATYTLTTCLSIPGTDVDHCSTADYPFSTDVPGQVEELVCPDSPDGGVLNIRWQQPTTNPSSVNDYVVEVQEIIHSPPGSRRLGLRTLTPPFRQELEVQPNVTLTASVTSGVEIFAPYNVSVTPRNAVGCGDVTTMTCFTQAGGVPTVPPAHVGISRSSDSSAIKVTWRPFTLVEARGFIEYLVQLHEMSSIVKRQDGLTRRVPMDQNSTTFTGLDVSVGYEASIRTISVSGDTVGPVSGRVIVVSAQAAQSSHSTIIIAVCVSVVVLLTVAMVLAAAVIIVALRSRRSKLDIAAAARSSTVDMVQLNPATLERSHQYEYVSRSSEEKRTAEGIATREGSSGQDFNVTSCAAYTPSLTSAPFDEEYAEVRTPSERYVLNQARVETEYEAV